MRYRNLHSTSQRAFVRYGHITIKKLENCSKSWRKIMLFWGKRNKKTLEKIFHSSWIVSSWKNKSKYQFISKNVKKNEKKSCKTWKIFKKWWKTRSKYHLTFRKFAKKWKKKRSKNVNFYFNVVRLQKNLLILNIFHSKHHFTSQYNEKSSI